LMQVSGGFQVAADWCWLVLVGALVGDGSASDDAPWLAIVTAKRVWRWNPPQPSARWWWCRVYHQSK
jgi:hypothetical protein